MKVTKSLFLAMAGLALFSCQKEEGVSTNVGGNELLTGENSSVFLKLGGIETTSSASIKSGRSMGTPSGDGNATGEESQTSLSSVALLFVNPAGDIMKVEMLTKTGNSEAFNQIIGSGKDYEGVPGGVKNVYALGNYEGKSTVPGGEEEDPTLQAKLEEAKQKADAYVSDPSSKDFVNISAIDKFSVGLSKLQDVKSALVYGKGGLKTVQGSTEDAKQFTCTVTMKHLVSRIEVKSIACTDMTENSKYSQIDLKYIGIGNYYINTNVDGTVQDKDYMGIVRTGNQSETYNKIGVTPTDQAAEAGGYAYVWGGTDPYSTSAKYVWAWDAVKNADKSSDVSFTHSNASVTYDQNLQYSYSFVPKKAPSALTGITEFNIKLVVDAKERGNTGTGGSSDISSAFTTVTGNFKDFEYGFYDQPGKILKVALSFKEDNISGWDPQQSNQVKVSVTVEPWKIYADVVPTYE